MTSANLMPRRRPGTVTTAVVIQVILVALTVISAILSMIYADTIADAMRAELERQNVPPGEIDQYTGGSGANLGSMAFSLVIALAYLVTAVFNWRGSRASRVVTWVLSGLFLLCNVVLTSFSLASLGEVEGVDLDAMVQAGNDALPGWYGAWSMISLIVSLLGYLAVVILLALPASNEFFRKQEPPVILPPEAMGR
ncbi:hypothetical protein [Stackebrandtia soli]|uniref:hypothetical protein n=1 Tax=Stackebrandtia soli TaxID=1892856 RepID=UPI0039EB824D